MAFGVYEYPHTDYYDSDLSELIKFYKIAVDDYNEIVQKVREAQRQWQESIDYVEKWNQKWQRDIIELRQEFNKATEEIKTVQKELIKRFEIERLGITSYVNDVLQQIKADNDETEEYVTSETDRAIREIEQRLKEYQQNLNNAINIWNDMVKDELDNLSNNFKENMNQFKEFMKDELDTIMSIFESYEASVNAYYDHTATLYNNLLREYEAKLQANKDAVGRELDDLYGRITREYEADDDDVVQQLNEKIEELRERIEEVNQARVDIQADKVLVKSPITHLYKRIQWVLDEMWTFYQVWSLEMWEIQELGLTVGRIKDWVCDKGLIPNHKGVEVLDVAAMGKWIFLEKPDILAQLQGQIEQITYDKLAENEDRIVQEVTATATSYFAGIVNTVTVIAGKLQPMQDEIDANKAAIGVNSSSISAMDTRVTALEEKSIRLAEEIVTTTSVFNAKLQSTNDNVETLINLQDEIEQVVGNISATMQDAKFTINENGNFAIVKGE